VSFDVIIDESLGPETSQIVAITSLFELVTMSRLRARKLLCYLSESLYSEYKLESYAGLSRLSEWSESGHTRLTGLSSQGRSATSWVCRGLVSSGNGSSRDSAVCRIEEAACNQNSRRWKGTQGNLQKEAAKKKSKDSNGVLKLTMPPVSLECHDRIPAVPTADENASSFRKLLLWVGGYYSKQSALLRAAAELNECINEQALNANVAAGATYSQCSLVLHLISMHR